MKTYIQKNIMINPDLWEKAKILSDTLKGENVSSIIRKALESYLEKETKDNLEYLLRTNITEYVDEEEQKELEEQRRADGFKEMNIRDIMRKNSTNGYNAVG